VGTHWETGKNNPSCPPKLKRNISKAPWALPLAERKTNPHPPPQKNLHGKSTVHTKYSLKKKTSPPNSPPTSHPAIGNSLGEHIENLGEQLGNM